MKLFDGYADTGQAEDILFVKQLLKKLRDYDWPGNVRELGNMMERAYVLLSQKEEYEFVDKYIQSYLKISPTEKRTDAGDVKAGQMSDESGNLENWEMENIYCTGIKEESSRDYKDG